MEHILQKPWWELITPREYLMSPTFNESIFTIDLSTVIMNRGPELYFNPVMFFSTTTITSSLYKLFITVLHHLTEQNISGKVIQLEAGYGGGKTHSLVALYHIITSTPSIINADLLEKNLLTYLEKIDLRMIQKCKIVSIVGTSLRAHSIRQLENNLQIKTLWGELAYQLGGINTYKEVQADDQNFLSPGVEVLSHLLGQFSPVLILIDELITYLVKARGVETNNTQSNLQAQTLVFLQELTQTVVRHTNVVLVISLPSNFLEVPDTVSEDVLKSTKTIIQTSSPVENELLLKRSKKITGRIIEKYLPYNDVELFQIIQKQLFNPIKENQALIVSLINEYTFYYKKFSSFFPQEATTDSYTQMMLYSYPFHPELIKYLASLWLTRPDFQGLRGLLKFLVFIIQDHYYNKRFYNLIHPGSINFNSEKLLFELSGFNREYIQNVIKADITGNELSNALVVNSRLQPEYQSRSIAVQVAQAIFFHSLHGFIGLSDQSSVSNITIKELRLIIASPNVSHLIIDHIIEMLLQNCWYLHEDSSIYFFNNQPNLNKLLVDYEDGSFTRLQQLKALKELITSSLNTHILEKKFHAKSYIFPSNPSLDIPDEPKIRLIFLDDNYALENTVIANNEIQLKIDALFTSYKKRRRIYINSMLLVAPNKTFLQEAMGLQVRLHSAVKLHEKLKIETSYLNISVIDLNNKIKVFESSLLNTMKKIFRYLIFKEESSLKILDLYPASTAHSSLIELIFQRLSTEHKLISSLHPKVMLSRYNIFDPTGTVTLLKLRNFFHQYSSFPLLVHDDVLRESIKQGIEQQLFDIIDKNSLMSVSPNISLDNNDALQHDGLFTENFLLVSKIDKSSTVMIHNDKPSEISSPGNQSLSVTELDDPSKRKIFPEQQLSSINKIFYDIHYNNKDLYKLIQFVNFLVQKAEIIDLNITIQLQCQQRFNALDIEALQNLENKLLSENPDIRINKRFS